MKKDGRQPFGLLNPICWWEKLFIHSTDVQINFASLKHQIGDGRIHVIS